MNVRVATAIFNCLRGLINETSTPAILIKASEGK